MTKDSLDLKEGTLSALLNSDKILNSKETVAKKKQDSEGAITLELDNGKIIFTYINEKTGKTVLEHTVKQDLEGHSLIEASWSLEKGKINLFLDGELVGQKKTEKIIDQEKGFKLFKNGVM